MINIFSSCIVGSSSTAPASFTPTSAASSTSNSPSHSSKTNAAAIGGAFGGALILALLFWLYKKRNRASQPDPGMLPQTNEHKITGSPPSTRLSAVPSPLLTDTPAVLSPPPWTDTPAIPSPPLTNSPTPVAQVYQDALQKTYVSIHCRHLTMLIYIS